MNHSPYIKDIRGKNSCKYLRICIDCRYGMAIAKIVHEHVPAAFGQLARNLLPRIY